jgi:ATP-binding cassette subfamily C protein LapB
MAFRSEARWQRKWLREILRPLRGAFRELLTATFFINLLALAVPVFVLQVYDRVVFFAGLSTLRGLVIGIAVALVFDFILRQARSRMLQRAALHIDVELGRRLFDKTMALPLRVLEGKPASHWQSLFRDIETVRNAFSGASAVLLADLPFAILFVAFITVIATPIAWLFLVIVPVFLLLAWGSGRTLSAASARERNAGLGRDHLVGELTAGRATIKALALKESLRPVWENAHAETIERSLERGSRADTYLNLGMSLTLATTVLLTTVGAVAIIDQRITVGALIATNMIASRIIGPFQQLVSQWRTFSLSRQATARLDAAFAATVERQGDAVALERSAGRLTVEGVSFAYEVGRGAKPVIDDINLNINAPGLHAIVGPNGSGKTTLLKLMQGLYSPDSGRVLIDGADVGQFSRTQIVRWVGYLPQELFLFAGSVRENIAKASPAAADEAVMAAARLAGVHEHIVDLPDGYGTEIGEAGRRLSGGLRQRLAIARALMGEPAVLLLDEPSAGLDREAEEALRDTLVALARERNVIVVSHSHVLLPACDNVLALDKGRIALAGPAREVLPRLFPAKQPATDAPAEAAGKKQA